MNRVRFYNIRLDEVESYDIEKWNKWDKTWAVSHVWDNKQNNNGDLEKILINSWKNNTWQMETWKTEAFYCFERYKRLMVHACNIAEKEQGEYIWMDAICIRQDDDEDKCQQISSNMRYIFSRCNGCIAFGPLTQDSNFSNIVESRNGDVCINTWFERVWTYQEMQLPDRLLFVVSDNEYLEKRQLYWFILLSSMHIVFHDSKMNIHDVINGLSKGGQGNTCRALIQASKRKSFVDIDKIYGVLGAMNSANTRLMKYVPDYSVRTCDAMKDIMKIMDHKDLVDMLTLNCNYRYEMVNFDIEVEHPPHSSDIYFGKNARVEKCIRCGNSYIEIENVPVWKCSLVLEQPYVAGDDNEHSICWPSIKEICDAFKIKWDECTLKEKIQERHILNRFMTSSKHESNADEIPTLDDKVRALVEFVQNKNEVSPDAPLPPTRYSGKESFINDQPFDLILCRQKENRDFYYGMHAAQDHASGIYTKVCTVSARKADVRVYSEVTEERVRIKMND